MIGLAAFSLIRCDRSSVRYHPLLHRSAMHAAFPDAADRVVNHEMEGADPAEGCREKALIQLRDGGRLEVARHPRD